MNKMLNSMKIISIALLIIMCGNMNLALGQELLGPKFLASIHGSGAFPRNEALIACNSSNRVYLGGRNEVVFYDIESQSTGRLAGTGEGGTITEGIATEVPMSIQSIAVGPQDQLHILSEGHIGRVNSNGMIELLEFETESGGITNKIMTEIDNPLVHRIVFTEKGDLFIHTFDGKDVGDVIYQFVDNKLVPFVGGGDISLVGGNSENPNRLDVKLGQVSALETMENNIYFTVGEGNDFYVYKVSSSDNIQRIANLRYSTFLPITENALLIKGSPVISPENTADRRLKRYSISLYYPEQEIVTYLTDIPSELGRMDFGVSENNVLYIANHDLIKHTLFSIPDISSYINNNTNITDWKNHE